MYWSHSLAFVFLKLPNKYSHLIMISKDSKASEVYTLIYVLLFTNGCGQLLRVAFECKKKGFCMLWLLHFSGHHHWMLAINCLRVS